MILMQVKIWKSLLFTKKGLLVQHSAALKVTLCFLDQQSKWETRKTGHLQIRIASGRQPNLCSSDPLKQLPVTPLDPQTSLLIPLSDEPCGVCQLPTISFPPPLGQSP